MKLQPGSAGTLASVRAAFDASSSLAFNTLVGRFKIEENSAGDKEKGRESAIYDIKGFGNEEEKFKPPPSIRERHFEAGARGQMEWEMSIEDIASLCP